MIALKVRDTDFGKMIFLCDEKLLGAELKDEKISMKINREFYDEFLDEKKERKKIIDILKESEIVNAIGEKSVEIVREVFKIKKIFYVKDVPHIQIYTI
ncbi:MAG: DUF424 family protein [Candidatus Micrarchaeia archaeon]